MNHCHSTEGPAPASHCGVRHRSGCQPGSDGTPRKTDAFQRVLSIRARVDREDAARFTREALREIRSYINEAHLEVEGPPFSIAHPLPDHRLDVEAGWPIGRGHGRGRIHSGALPLAQARTCGESGFSRPRADC